MMAGRAFHIVDVFAEEKYVGNHFGDTDIDVRIEQGFEIGRPSLLRVRAQAAVEGFQVQVGGRVIPVARGELL
jgi:trans-2,3-dihydro-3-hydroxyanthranilate isomerase